MLKILIHNEEFILHPSGGIFWISESTLLIADVHLGKVSHFRKHGFAIPNEAIYENFRRLEEVVAFFDPKSIVFLGDLFHSKINLEWELFEQWVAKTPSEIVLVEGNHDIITKTKYADIGVNVFKEMNDRHFLFTHKPVETEDLFNFCGHIHPGIQLRGMGRQSLKLPCFFQKPHQMILPAFGEFTGKFLLAPTETDNVYIIANEEVIAI